MTQVDIDIERSEMNVTEIVGLGDDLEKVSETKECVKYCRRCEVACPVGS